MIIVLSGVVTKQAIAQCETSFPAKCLADLDNDCQVTSADLAIVLADFGCQTGCCIGDVDLDGKTGESDLGAVLAELDNCTGLRVLPLIVWVDDPNDPNDPVPLPVGHRGAAFADFDADDWPDATLFVDGVRRLYEVRARVNTLRANRLTDLTGLETPLGITILGGLIPELFEGSKVRAFALSRWSCRRSSRIHRRLQSGSAGSRTRSCYEEHKIDSMPRGVGNVARNARDRCSRAWGSK